MQVVINIEDEIYWRIVEDNNNGYGNHATHAIRYGTPLPKGHGRLIILSEDKLKENQTDFSFYFQKWISEVGLSNATVAIIEADKAEGSGKDADSN